MSASDLRREREQRRKREYRNVILRAAEDVIIQKGYSAMTMDDVARASQFSKATLYKYFPSKSELVFEILLHYFDEVSGRLDAIAKEQTSAKEKVRRSIAMTIAFHEEKENISRVLLMDDAMMRFFRLPITGRTRMASPSDRTQLKVFQKKRQWILEKGAKIIEEGIANGEFRKTNPLAVVTFIDAVVQGYIHGRFWLEKSPDTREAAEMFYRFILEGIEKPGKSGKERKP